MIRFAALAMLWLADMGLLAVSGPVGAHPLRAAAAFAVGVFLMVLLVRWFPVFRSRTAAFGVVLLLGLTARLFFWSYPPDDDIYRYVWEGWIQHHGVNPYRHAPESSELSDITATLPGIREAVNQSHLPAAYPPFTLLLFRWLAGIRPDPQFFKLIFLLFDIGTIVMLGLLTRARDVPVAGVLYYAANPLSILYVAGEAHLDVIQVFFLAAGLWCLASRRVRTGFLMLGLAVAAKYVAVVVLPFFLSSRNWRHGLFALFPLASFLPFVDAGAGLFASLGHFGAHMHYNDGITSLMRLFLGPWTPWAAMGLLAGSLVLILLVEPDPFRSAWLATATLLLLMPTFHPWYLLLALPFLVLFPSPAWIYLSAGMVFTFPVLAFEWRTGVFQEIHWLKWLEFLPFWALLLFGLRRDQRPGYRRRYGPVSTVSVIVPTLNETGRIEHCLASLRDQEGIADIIVVDGGSTDGTPAAAAAAGARVIHTRPGRGHQIRTGIDATSGDLFWVLHGDSAINPGTARRVVERLNQTPSAPGGACGMQFAPADWKNGLVRRLNHLRARYVGIAFGDQGQFVRAEALAEMNGFPDLDLMEDVELSLRLKELGKPLYVDGGITVSSRRWQGGRFSAKVGLVLRLCFGFLLRRRFWGAEGLGRDYYTIYYRRHLEKT